MIRLLVSGTLVGAPVRRTSAKNTDYATCLVRSGTGQDAVVVSCISFAAEVVAELLMARDGELVSVGGAGSLRTWASKDGQQRTGLSVTIDRVLSIVAKPASKPKESRGHIVTSESESAKPLGPLPPGDLASIPSDLPF